MKRAGCQRKRAGGSTLLNRPADHCISVCVCSLLTVEEYPRHDDRWRRRLRRVHEPPASPAARADDLCARIEVTGRTRSMHHGRVSVAADMPLIGSRSN